MRPAEQLGARLREARLARGMTLADIQARTHIRREFLDALEQGDFQRLPGDVYVRGFLRAYAREVGLDPGEVVAAYDGIRAKLSIAPGNRDDSWALRRPQPLRHLAPIRRNGARVPRPSSLTMTLLVVLLAVTGVLAVRPFTAGGGLTLSEAGNPSEREGGVEGIAARRALPEWVAPFARRAQDGVPLSQEAAPEPARAGELPPPNWEAAWQLSPAVPQRAGGAAPSPAPAEQVAVGSVRLRAVARANGWAEVFVDGVQVFRGALLKGDDMVWQGRSVVRVRLEGAEGIELQLNGVRLPRSRERVLEREFRQADVAAILASGEGSRQ